MSLAAWEELRTLLCIKFTVFTAFPPKFWDELYGRLVLFIQSRFGHDLRHSVVHESGDNLEMLMSDAGMEARRREFAGGAKDLRPDPLDRLL